MSHHRITVDLEPVGKRVDVDPGATLLEAAQNGGVELVSLCGGVGVCSGCRVRVAAGQVTPPTLEEEAEFTTEQLAAGWRLACQTIPTSSVKIDIPPESLTTPQRLQVEGESAAFQLDPPVRPVDVQLDPAHFHDLRADVRRVEDRLGHPCSFGLGGLRDLSRVLREHDWSARLALRGGSEVAAVLPPGARVLGLAVDIGTTGLAAYLLDIESGETLAKTGAMNPQIAYGEDVISRIVHANTHPDGRATLQARLIDAINGMTEALCAEVGASPEQIADVVLVGNTAMHHLVLNLPVRQLGEAPYVPVTTGAIDIAAAEIGLKAARDARVFLPPNIAGYVGADHVAMLLATGAWRAEATTLAVDIGTNTEMTLIHNGRRLSCSCASGPAFEGAHIGAGMRAAPGAIERVQVLDGSVRTQTIGGKAPVGICGSGILDAVAVMVEQGIVNDRGAIQPSHPLVQDRAFVLASAQAGANGRAVSVSRKDVAEIQLAKAAIRAGVEILLARAGIEARDIQSVIIAGAFGTYISVASALRIGMFPDLPLDRFQQVGNAAGMGACQLLLSKAMRAQADTMVKTLEYIELTTHPDFQAIFVDHMRL